MGCRPEHAGQLAPLDHPASARTACAAWSTDYIDLYQMHRPEPDTDIDETLGALHRPRPPGQGALPRQLHVPGVGDRRGAVGGGATPARALRVRAAAVLDPRPGDRGRRAAHLPAPRHGRDPVEPARRRLAVGQVAQGRRPTSPATGPTGSRRATTSPCPGNQQKLEAADALGRLADEAGRPAGAPGGGVGDPQPRGHVGDHRPAHDGAAHHAARRRRRGARPATCSTASTRSSRPGPTSPGPTPATRRRWSPAAAPAGAPPADGARRGRRHRADRRARGAWPRDRWAAVDGRLGWRLRAPQPRHRCAAGEAAAGRGGRGRRRGRGGAWIAGRVAGHPHARADGDPLPPRRPARGARRRGVRDQRARQRHAGERDALG